MVKTIISSLWELIMVKTIIWLRPIMVKTIIALTQTLTFGFVKGLAIMCLSFLMININFIKKYSDLHFIVSIY